MAEYRLVFNYNEGSGRISVNGTIYQRGDIYIEEGTTISFIILPDEGFTFGEAIFNNNLISFGIDTFTWPMPSRDSRLIINVSGIPAPTNDYQIRYFTEYCDVNGKAIRIEILEFGFAGYPEAKKLGAMTFRYGSIGSDQFQTFVNTSFDFGLFGQITDFIDMLDGDNRRFQVKIYFDEVIFWTGYLNNSIFNWNVSADDQLIRFTASDGLVSLQSIRIIESYFNAFAGNLAIGALVSGLNQSFIEKRPLSVGCDIYETRMDRNVGLFEQFIIPANAIYTDGKQPQYLGDGGLIVNTSVFIDEGIKNLVRPFLCRVFLWKDRFYVVSTPELRKNDYRIFNYDEEADFVDTETIETNQFPGCRNSDGQATAVTVYTEFTTTLELGVVDTNSRGGIYDIKFVRDDFAIGSIVSPFAGIPFLSNWEYIRAVPSGQPSSYPTGTNPALVQYANDSLGERIKIWGTTSSFGLADSAISYIQIDQNRTGQGIPVIQELSNKISFKIEFICEPASTSSPVQPSSNQTCGIMLRIADQYLSFDGVDAFTWTGTETVMKFPLNALNAWNTLQIDDVVVPATGDFQIRLYEVINTGTADNHAIGFRNMNLTIEANEGINLATISRKAITTTQYSKVFDEYKTKIGDALTANSSSAIKLNITDTPVSESWSRDGYESRPLLEIIARELANQRGVINPRIVMTLVYDSDNNPFDLEPFRNIRYDGYNWLINAMEIDLFRNLWKLEIIRLAPVETETDGALMAELAYEL